MESTETITTFLGWCTVLNSGIIILATIVFASMGRQIFKIHSNFFHLREEEVAREWYRFLANYKIAIFVFNLVPYVALNLVS